MDPVSPDAISIPQFGKNEQKKLQLEAFEPVGS
jgi:hypothetical protein